MPYTPKRPCRHPGCPETSGATYCDKHRKTKQRNESKQRDRGKQIYKTARWLRVRKAKLARNPLCEECLRQQRTRPAKDVHHIEPVRDRPDLAYQISNLEALCHSCHSAETATEVGWRASTAPMGDGV
jgi:5-methylcytosine-specific restriction protein A